MKHRHDTAYVLGTSELGEADLIVTLLAERAGRVRGVAMSARRSRRRFGGALEPMSRVNARWVEREGRDLHRIESLDLDRSYADMQASPERQAACAVLCEILAAVSREEASDPREFRLVGAVLGALEGGLDPWLAVRYFEYWTLRLHGVLAGPDLCAACGSALSTRSGIWAAASGGLTCRRCAAGRDGVWRLGRSDLAFLTALATRSPADVVDPDDAARPGGRVERFLKGSLEAFVERPLRTYRHLRALAP